MAFKLSTNLSSDNSLLALADAASQRKANGLEYAGEIYPHEAFDYASKNPSIVVDVRTIPEWQFVGTPDLSNTPSRLLTLSWKLYPSFILNPSFIGDFIAETAITKDAPLFFICRSGGRSLDAAIAITAEGYNYCFNVIGGFEGEANGKGHRGTGQGWKHDGLPWVQG